MTTTATNRARTARVTLDTYATLRAAKDIEPESYDDGMPHDPAAWLDWYEHTYQPAYQAWDKAITDLQTALGDDFPGRHPYNFVPVCEHLVTGGAP